jgi:DNA end-binding protein Ku
VMIPVAVTSAREKRDVEFRQVHNADAGRIQFRRFCTACGEQVGYGDIVKGFERDDGTMIVMTDEDFADLPLSTAKSIDVLHFTPENQVAPELTDHLYYLNPAGGERAYGLVLEAMSKSRKVAIAKVAFRGGREHLASIRSVALTADGNVSGVLAMSTLRWPDEIRRPVIQELPRGRKQELSMATSLIESMTADFDPDAHTDQYRQAVIAAVEARSSGVPLAARSAAAAPPEERSLADALQASLDAVKPKDGAAARAPAAPRKRAPRKASA